MSNKRQGSLVDQIFFGGTSTWKLAVLGSSIDLNVATCQIGSRRCTSYFPLTHEFERRRGYNTNKGTCEKKTPHPPPLPFALLTPNPFIFTEIDYIRQTTHLIKPPPGGPSRQSLENTDTNRPIILCISYLYAELKGGGGINRCRRAPCFILPPGRKILSTSPCSFFFTLFFFLLFLSSLLHDLVHIGWSALSVWPTSGPPHPHFNQPRK